MHAPYRAEVDAGETTFVARHVGPSLLLTIGLAIGSLTLSGWWFQQTVLDPSRTARVANAVIDEMRTSARA